MIEVKNFFIGIAQMSMKKQLLLWGGKTVKLQHNDKWIYL